MFVRRRLDGVSIKIGLRFFVSRRKSEKKATAVFSGFAQQVFFGAEFL